MTVILIGFFGYHIRLAWNNMTTNESAKRDQCHNQLKRENQILDALISETQKWNPEGEQTEMPKISLDDEPLPR